MAAAGGKRTLESLNFDNSILRTLPVDKTYNNRSRLTPGVIYSLVNPTPLKDPKLVAFSPAGLSLLDLEVDGSAGRTEAELTEYFSGNKILPGSETAAHCYCGYQFGYFAGQLGDGAAMYLGEIVNGKGERWEIQLKGAGPTPYSRSFDGRKVLRSSIREFLCSEYMYALGIPTTRAGTVVTSDTYIGRFLNNEPLMERCSVVLRISPTFIRFGSFEIFIDNAPSEDRVDLLRQLLDYTIQNHYPEIWAAEAEGHDRYAKFYREVVLRTARLAAEWQLCGFNHGVINTDNTSIIGVTIDYGPYGFMDVYDPDYICNTTDENGRYSYSNQWRALKWNCARLAEALASAVPTPRLLPALEEFQKEYDRHYAEKFRQKLGLREAQDGDELLQMGFFEAMYHSKADFTNSFRSLSRIGARAPGADPSADLTDAESTAWVEYLLAHACKVEAENAGYNKTLNPMRFVKIGKDKPTRESVSAQWLEWLKKYRARIDAEAARVEDLAAYNAARAAVMNRTNPAVCLRNSVAQYAIDAAEKGDYEPTRAILNALMRPFEEHPLIGTLDLHAVPDPMICNTACSCSS